MNPGATKLQVVYSWRRTLLDYRLLDAGDAVTVGDSKRATLIAPRGPGIPARRQVVKARRVGARLRVWPGMSGAVSVGGQQRDLAEVLAGPAPRRLIGHAAWREVDLGPDDAATVHVDEASGLTLRVKYVEPPEAVGAPRLASRDPLLFKVGFFTACFTLLLLIGILVLGKGGAPEPIAITPDRFAKLVEPVLRSPSFKAAQEQAKAEAAERKRKEREAAESKRMKGNEGKLGRNDARARDTILPKGREDILREKVSKTGVLAALGNAKARGSGLGKLLTEQSNDVEQALNGLEGAKLVAGRGAGGVGNAGTGLGGGGTGFGRIQGSGDVDVGAGRGRGRKGPSLGSGKEKEVSVGMTTGTPDAEGGLSKEQINRVVRAHAAAVKYCYEKELQRHPQLSGKIEMYWVIRPNGAVDRVKVAQSTVGNHDVESCIERQVRAWQFPRSDAQTIVQSYPFLFKGAG